MGRLSNKASNEDFARVCAPMTVPESAFLATIMMSHMVVPIDVVAS